MNCTEQQRVCKKNTLHAVTRELSEFFSLLNSEVPKQQNNHGELASCSLSNVIKKISRQT